MANYIAGPRKLDGAHKESELLFSGYCTVNGSITLSKPVKEWDELVCINMSVSGSSVRQSISNPTSALLFTGFTYHDPINGFVFWDLSMTTNDGTTYYIARNAQINVTGDGVQYLTNQSDSQFNIYGVRYTI